MDNFATLFTRLAEALRSAIIAQTVRDRARTAALIWLSNYIGRTARRVERLYAAWRAGTIAPPRPRAPRPAPAEGAEPPPRPKPPVARTRGLVAAIIGARAPSTRGNLHYLLTRPDCADFLREVPRAGRLLRPLCHLLDLRPTAELTLPPRPRRPRPPKPRPASPHPEPPRYGKHPLHRSRTYSPGPIPAFKTRLA